MAVVALPTLLSQLLVAHTIELDNEAEHRLPHRIQLRRGSGNSGTWLTSWPMYANLLRYVPDDGVRLGDIAGLARVSNVKGLVRWGYLRVAPADEGQAIGDRTVTLKPGGHLAREVWAPLPAEVDARWVRRFGAQRIDALVRSLGALLGQLSAPLPLALPIITAPTGGLLTGRRRTQRAGEIGRSDEAGLTALLARTLMAFTLDHEDDARVSLPLAVDLLRVVDPAGVRRRDLPRLTGISVEALASATKLAERRELITVARGSNVVVQLTRAGAQARRQATARSAAVEADWESRYGSALVAAVHQALTDLRDPGLLTEGLTPYDNGWRNRPPYLARTRALLADPLAVLPHQPMPLHRGAYPDGS